MNFTLSTIAKSLADYLASSFPSVSFYEDPNQQGTAAPCMFLQQRYANTELKQGGRFLQKIALDLTYLEDYNLPDLQSKYQTAAEKLDLLLETFPYNDGTSEITTLLRTYNREWRIDLDAMHYKFELQVWETIPKSGTPMREMEYSEEVRDG